MNQSTLYALDFDGVICDSAVETGITGWKAASQLWSDMPKAVPAERVEQFREVRPIIETGYEAILAMRLLHLGYSCEVIQADFNHQSQTHLQQEVVSVEQLKALFGTVRDSWIAEDLADWIAQNPLFPGIADKLKQLNSEQSWFVVTTKQERFVKHILQAHGIELSNANIYGLDRNLSKVAVLQELSAQYPEATLYFLEDRLPTLINVSKQAELARVKLVFALWGYNTDEDKHLAEHHGFTLQQLENFLE